jgi:hypothetical protein
MIKNTVLKAHIIWLFSLYPYCISSSFSQFFNHDQERRIVNPIDGLVESKDEVLLRQVAKISRALFKPASTKR